MSEDEIKDNEGLWKYPQYSNLEEGDLLFLWKSGRENELLEEYIHRLEVRLKWAKKQLKIGGK